MEKTLGQYRMPSQPLRSSSPWFSPAWRNIPTEDIFHDSSGRLRLTCVCRRWPRAPRWARISCVLWNGWVDRSGGEPRGPSPPSPPGTRVRTMGIFRVASRVPGPVSRYFGKSNRTSPVRCPRPPSRSRWRDAGLVHRLDRANQSEPSLLGRDPAFRARRRVAGARRTGNG